MTIFTGVRSLTHASRPIVFDVKPTLLHSMNNAAPHLPLSQHEMSPDVGSLLTEQSLLHERKATRRYLAAILLKVAAAPG